MPDGSTYKRLTNVLPQSHIDTLKVGFFLSTSLFLVFSYYFLGERRWKYILIFSFPFVAIFMYLLHGVLAVYLRDPLLKYIGIMG